MRLTAIVGSYRKGGVIDTADGRGNQMEGSPVGENPG